MKIIKFWFGSVIECLPDEIPDLYRKILLRIIEQDPTKPTQTFLKILFLSRVGIWENEVASLIVYFSDIESISTVTYLKV
jgi:hypothetical protein